MYCIGVEFICQQAIKKHCGKQINYQDLDELMIIEGYTERIMDKSKNYYFHISFF